VVCRKDHSKSSFHKQVDGSMLLYVSNILLVNIEVFYRNKPLNPSKKSMVLFANKSPFRANLFRNKLWNKISVKINMYEDQLEQKWLSEHPFLKNYLWFCTVI
jgi:hypothetical protein